MMRHGVALIRVGRISGVVDEFYGVYFHGRLHPEEFKSFNEAMRHFVAMRSKRDDQLAESVGAAA